MWTEEPWFDSRQKNDNILFSETSRSALDNSQVRIQWTSRCHGPLFGKEQGSEADHTTLANAQIKNEWSYTSMASTETTLFYLISKSKLS